MLTAFERRAKRLRDHVLGHNKQREKTMEEMTVEELRELAKERGFEGYSKFKKDDLIELLNEGE